ncbi:MAG TPA: tRNA (adenosine(37)-N6)-threonylcarbamoyltransferase complex dimerization subunit type 1 TsaB [Chryseosolibacter sp.]
MALILSLETSASACSVALHKKGQLVYTIEIAEPQAHAGKLAVLIDELLKIVSISPQDLKAVAVSAGPGSYTGLRIGTSVAKGLCMGLGIPLLGIPTLLSMAHHVSQATDDKFLCPLIDARRMEVYAQIFDNQLNPINNTEAIVVDSNSFRELLDRQHVLFFGDGAEKCKGVINHPNASFADGVYPKASFIGAIAWQEFEANRFADLVEFTPFYLKEFVAKKAQPIF